ncbi:hypothetical protein FA95DRAFT_1573687 [Auriscalpium vulgare]|uniref:Uncharacterized protein n=1 Tax=Auriscalpium vulgare TaxID=40419 RepID=A0ACB8RPK0_9AGAM|nr:hypothetical protein FA95DRAFT_1573687 [Auriscalpium vulgare]
MSGSIIVGLPNEVLRDILTIAASTARASSPFRQQFKTFVDSDLELKCTIKLAALVMYEGPDAHCLTVSERLRRLQAAQATDGIKLEELPFIPALGNSVDLLLTSVTTLVSELPTDDGLRVYVQQMPSIARGIEERQRHWSLWFSDCNYSVAAVDASAFAGPPRDEEQR